MHNGLRVITYRLADGYRDIEWAGEIMPTAADLDLMFGEPDARWTSIRYVAPGGNTQDGNQGTQAKGGKWPMVSHASGVNAKQVPMMRKMYPHHVYKDDGRMIFMSQNHQRKCLADIGMRNVDDYSR